MGRTRHQSARVRARHQSTLFNNLYKNMLKDFWLMEHLSNKKWLFDRGLSIFKSSDFDIINSDPIADLAERLSNSPAGPLPQQEAPITAIPVPKPKPQPQPKLQPPKQPIPPPILHPTPLPRQPSPTKKELIPSLQKESTPTPQKEPTPPFQESILIEPLEIVPEPTPSIPTSTSAPKVRPPHPRH